VPYTIGNYLAPLLGTKPVPTDDPVFKEAEAGVQEKTRELLAIKGTHSVEWFHRELGKITWDHCGMARSKESLEKAVSEIATLRDQFWKDVKVLGGDAYMNQELEHAGRVADFMEFNELMCRDALHREESCGGHFRVEHQTDEGEAQRDDDNFSYVGAWEWTGSPSQPSLHKEQLEFEYCKPSQRSYK